MLRHLPSEKSQAALKCDLSSQILGGDRVGGGGRVRREGIHTFLPPPEALFTFPSLFSSPSSSNANLSPLCSFSVHLFPPPIQPRKDEGFDKL